MRMADDLIEIAKELALRDAGRPKSTSLRRATSSAYYALFHALAELCADALVGWKEPWPVLSPVYRSLEHAKARSVLNEVRREGPRGSSLESVAVAFAALQDARYDADYNPEQFRFNRSGTIELIDAAEQAVTAIELLSRDERLSLAVRLIIKPRGHRTT